MAYSKDKKVVGVPIPLILFEQLKKDSEEDIIFNTVPKQVVKIINDYYQDKKKNRKS